MVICPIAMAVHCSGCPVVKICPAKTILGDYGKDVVTKPEVDTTPADTPKGPSGSEKD